MIRAARATDYPTFVRLFRELGVDDPTIEEPRFVRDVVPTMLVAEDGARVLGYAHFLTFDEVTHVRHVVTAPDARRCGVGRALMLHIARIARDAGCTSWRLNVKPDNASAIALYESLGFVRMFRSRSLTLAWARVDEQPPVSAEIAARDVSATDDARIEEKASLARGQLAVDRARGRIVVAVEERGELAGIALFDPKFPGAFPFRASRVELAIALLRAIRPHAPSDGNVHLTIENEPEVTDALVAMGATVRLEILHMRGSLPAT